MHFNKLAAIGLVAVTAALGLTACSTDADTVAYNLSQDAEAFELTRRITVINAFTDAVVLQVEGKCSLETADSFLAGAVEVTCKVGPDAYFKDYFLVGDNGIVSVEQVETVNVDEYHYKWIIKPETVLPDIEIRTGVNDTGDGDNEPTVNIPSPEQTDAP